MIKEKNDKIEIESKIIKNVKEQDEIILPTALQIEDEISRLKNRRDYIHILFNTIASLIVVAAIAVLISSFLLPVLRVTGTSMTPTLTNGTVVVCKRTTSLKRGDIVAFYYNNKVLLKRVIGLPGDYIEVRTDGTVLVNNEAIDEPYIDGPSYGENDLTYPYQVPEDRYFVMGDHRSTSVDSRSKTIGCVSEEEVLGKVKMAIWPIDKFKILK
ncbi:signal peptidase I [Eubacterium uniforme]|uniref:Signal peptidase I n=1 Tax=Eubacterium uniforme TaxID=39495 RepID=A0A1T4VZ95_9FIRM|nr:signal peptidase I [Eubacterium uniforme]SKA69791.1 signal peptidase I [Eubacterium uniforme]HAH19071.1 signal peptidase I [Eubacterium sp.]